MALALWLAGVVIAYAQQPTDLRLEKHAEASQVVPGERLRFTLTLTNEGAGELNGLVVSDATPAGTAFFGAAGPRDWMITTPHQGGEGEVVWRSTAPLRPGESVELKLLVTVQVESGGSLISQGCTVQAEGWDSLLTGPTVTVAVVAPTDTPQPLSAVIGSNWTWLGFGISGLALILGAVAAAGWLRRRTGR
jgi:uncharacterized repeat protein (TIGR01451 family)